MNSSFDKDSFDKKAKKAIPSIFFTLCSSTGGEESEESYNVGKCFKFPQTVAEKSGSACVSAFLHQQYAKEKDDFEDLSMERLLDIKKMLRRNKFQQTPVMSCSRPIRSTTKLHIASSAQETRRAVLIGINYNGQRGHELKSSHYDALRLAELLVTRYGFLRENVLLLLDDDEHDAPTKRRIEDAFLDLAKCSEPGDFNFISFSGHGSQIKDTSGDEESGYDSTIIPVDAKTNGQVIDDDILEMLVKPMKAGVTTMALVDGCHSSNIFDLPYSYGADQKKQKRKKGFDMSVVKEAVRPLSAKERYQKEKAARKAEKAAKRAAQVAASPKEPAEETPYVTKDAQGRTVIMGNPTPEQLAQIQQQMIAEAQAAAMANMSLAPGQTVQFQVLPAAAASTSPVGTHTTTSQQGGVTTTTTTVSRVIGYGLDKTGS